jgi:predicted N-formylglutamate amidohydrolase
MPTPIDPTPLLDADEPPPVLELNRNGNSDFVIAIDHASRLIPRRLANLGLSEQELSRHIAWDIGALAVAKAVSEALDAPLVAQNYSRLVIDCNRHPDAATSIPEIGEFTPIPGNNGLSPAERTMRRAAIFEPYHRHLADLLDERQAAGRTTILVAQHSMTNIFKGQQREMHAAIMYNRDRRFAAAMLAALRDDPALTIADNQPYFVSDETDYTIPCHGEARHLPHVAIEIRQDLITDPTGQTDWGRRIAAALTHAETHFRGQN